MYAPVGSKKGDMKKRSHLRPLRVDVNDLLFWCNATRVIIVFTLICNKVCTCNKYFDNWFDDFDDIIVTWASHFIQYVVI